VTRILVTDADERAALTLVRAFGKRGHEVELLAPHKRPLAAASRYCRRLHVGPSPLDPPPFVDCVSVLVRDRGIEVVLPVTEAAALALLPPPIRDRLRPAVVPFPDFDRFRAVCDKGAVLHAAADEGVSVPEQLVIAGRRIPEGDRERLRFPLVVKPTRSVGGSGNRRLKFTVSHADDPAELEGILERLPPEGYPVLLQRRVLGPGLGVFLLVWDGEVRAEFGHRRLREKPPAGGVSVYSESTPLDPGLRDQSVRLLQRLGWQGVAMLEYKLEEESGTPYLMEINGRFWGSLQLALDAGVDFPNLLLDCFAGRAFDPPRFQTGVRLRWWWGDVDHLLARLRHSRRTLHLTSDARGRGRVIADFLKLRPSDCWETWRRDDPRPFVRESMRWLLRK